jgi:hypothetical protein
LRGFICLILKARGGKTAEEDIGELMLVESVLNDQALTSFGVSGMDVSFERNVHGPARGCMGYSEQGALETGCGGSGAF